MTIEPPFICRLFTVQQERLTSDDVYTPSWIFDAMDIRFDLDVCAPPGGVPWIPADRYYTQAEDGLSQPWEGRVWMNPPFSACGPWVDRFIAHGHGVALTPMAKARWARALWDAADGVGNAAVENSDGMRFALPDGGTSFRPINPIFFFAFGPECVEAIGRLGMVRSAS